MWQLVPHQRGPWPNTCKCRTTSSRHAPVSAVFAAAAVLHDSWPVYMVGRQRFLVGRRGSAPRWGGVKWTLYRYILPTLCRSSMCPNRQRRGGLREGVGDADLCRCPRSCCRLHVAERLSGVICTFPCDTSIAMRPILDIALCLGRSSGAGAGVSGENRATWCRLGVLFRCPSSAPCPIPLRLGPCERMSASNMHHIFFGQAAGIGHLSLSAGKLLEDLDAPRFVNWSTDDGLGHLNWVDGTFGLIVI